MMRRDERVFYVLCLHLNILRLLSSSIAEREREQADSRAREKALLSSSHTHIFLLLLSTASSWWMSQTISIYILPFWKLWKLRLFSSSSTRYGSILTFLCNITRRCMAHILSHTRRRWCDEEHFMQIKHTEDMNYDDQIVFFNLLFSLSRLAHLYLTNFLLSTYTQHITSPSCEMKLLVIL